VDNSTSLWTKRSSASFIHRRPNLSTDRFPHSSTPSRPVGPARTRAIHTTHNTYYCGCFDLFNESTRKEQERGGQLGDADSPTRTDSPLRRDSDAAEGVESLSAQPGFLAITASGRPHQLPLAFYRRGAVSISVSKEGPL